MDNILLSSIELGTVARASSVQNRKAKTFGPMNVLNLKNSSSCWNSEGTPPSSTTAGVPQMQTQWLQIEFPNRLVHPKSLQVQFQPGFSCEACHIQFLQKRNNNNKKKQDEKNNKTADPNNEESPIILSNEKSQPSWEAIAADTLDWEDVHTLQKVDLSDVGALPCSAIRLIWEDGQFTDMYGRVVIYQIQVWGQELSSPAAAAVVEETPVAS